MNNSNRRFFSQNFKLTRMRRDDFVLFFFFFLVHQHHPQFHLQDRKKALSNLLSRVSTLSASSSIRLFECRTVCSSSLIDLWQAVRPVINCCVESHEDSVVDPLDWTEDNLLLNLNCSKGIEFLTLNKNCLVQYCDLVH